MPNFSGVQLLIITAGLLVNCQVIEQTITQDNDWRCGEVGNSCLYGFCRYECLKESCNPQKTQIIGDQVLILDYNSLYYSGGDSKPIVLDTAASCCEECKRMDDCNAYAFCDSPLGCGEGCLEYVDQNPVVDPAGELPFKGFGPFGGCYGEGQYPYQMCKLMIVASTTNYTTSDSGRIGFISGVFDDKAGECGELNRFVCEACQESQDFGQCFGCATQKSIPSNSQHYCGKCSSLDFLQQDQCSACLGQYGIDGGCGQCMVTAQTDDCLDCSANFENPLTQLECRDCSNRENFQLCVDCLGSEQIDIEAKEQCPQCTRNEISIEFQQRCVGCMERESGFDAALCGSCASSASELSQCFDCLETLDGDSQRYCPICSTDKNPTQCYLCLQDQRVSAKVHCSTCALRSSYMDLCIDCLKDADIQKALKCTRCANSEDEQACLNCYINAQDVSQCDSCTSGECYTSAAVQPLQVAKLECQQKNDSAKAGNCSSCLEQTGMNGVGSCAFCSESIDPDACIQCVVSGSKNDSVLPQNCLTCMSLQDQTQRSQCLDCISNSINEQDAFQCSKCARSNSPSCFACVSGANSLEQKQACA